VSSIQLLGDVNLEVLARPPRIGEDSAFGCPGCQSEDRLIDVTYPPLLAPLYSEAQYSAFLDSLNDALSSTSVPPCPLALGALVLPLPLGCLFWYCRDSRALEREEAVATLIEQENARLARRGLQWTEAQWTQPRVCPRSSCCYSCCGGRDCCSCCSFLKTVPALRGTLTLHLNIQVRASFELDNPTAPQYLANLLLERSQKLAALARTGTATGPPRTLTGGSSFFSGGSMDFGSSSDDPNSVIMLAGGAHQPLDETQARLLHRQVTIVRKASLSRGALLLAAAAAGGGGGAPSTPGSPLAGSQPLSSPSGSPPCTGGGGGATAAATPTAATPTAIPLAALDNNNMDSTNNNASPGSVRWAQPTTTTHHPPARPHPDALFVSVMPARDAGLEDAEEEEEVQARGEADRALPPPPSGQRMD
jgi:hypothetical protein